MPSFIFLCDLSTEQECLDRQLFGTNPGESQRHHYSKIAPGDGLFLYNLETGQLWGPYTAATACLQNIEPEAWRKTRRKFPWQVRVDGREAHAKAISADVLVRLVPLASTKAGLLPPPELSDEQTAAVLAEFGRANESA